MVRYEFRSEIEAKAFLAADPRPPAWLAAHGAVWGEIKVPEKHCWFVDLPENELI